MTKFSLAMCICLVISCSLGYHLSCNSALQGALLPRQISCRTAQLFGTLFVLIVTWFHAPNLLTATIPLAISLLYAGTAVGLAILSTRPHKVCQCAGLREFVEVSVSTGISVTFSMGIALLTIAVLTHLPAFQANGFVSAFDQLLCHSLLLLINTLLLCLLFHQMFFLMKHPGEKGSANQAALEFQERSKNPPTMR